MRLSRKNLLLSIIILWSLSPVRVMAMVRVQGIPPVSFYAITPLPTSLPAKTTAPSAFLLRNNLPFALNDITFKPKAKNGQYTTLQTTCQFLLPGHTCLWQGRFTEGTDPSTAQTDLNAYYDGNLIPYPAAVKNGINNLPTLQVNTPLPANMAYRSNAVFFITFKNPTDTTLNNVWVSSASVAGLSVNNTCPSILAAHTTCSISGTYHLLVGVPAATLSFPISIHYHSIVAPPDAALAQTATVALETTATNQSLTARVINALPPDIQPNSKIIFPQKNGH